METRITATELARALSDILNRTRYRGESFVIERNGDPIAALVPVGPVGSVTAQELADRLRGLTLPGDGFAEDLEAAQASQPRLDRSPWDC
ncbi:MAG TPA: type II toxin-antitoxin system prevent-host-death family antitoxin [Dehalococcoidia bacterium]|nr:type II toxin-antitoxin system prevent-host-death family antitoxin [Dehalococcoidia bacterium]